MKVLVMTNLYPPLHKGGYEMICRLVTERLARRGHLVRVLTSKFGLEREKIEGEVHRVFNFIGYDFAASASFCRRLKTEIEDNRVLRREVAEFRPDIISVWHFTFLTTTMLVWLDSLRIPKVYNIASNWLPGWYYNRKASGWFGRFDYGRSRVKNLAKLCLKKAVSPLVPTEWRPLDLSCISFDSASVKDQHLEAGLPVSDGEVIYDGLELEKFPLAVKERHADALRLLWVGRITEYKGTHVAIEAAAILAGRYGLDNVRLSIVGDSDDRRYLARLRDLVAERGLEGRVVFEGWLSHDQTLRRYLESDILLFTSIYKEPFGLTWLEAFASGVPVVGTVTGGSREIFVDGENAIVCEAGDPESLASGVNRLVKDEDLFKRIQTNAIETAKKRFDIVKVVDRIERLYQGAVKRSREKDG